MFWVIIVAVVVLVVIGVVIYLLPDDPSPAKSKKKEKKDRSRLGPDPTTPAVPAAPDKDWKAIAERWEKNNNALMGDLEKSRMQEKKTLKAVDEQKAQNKELMDKLALEKSWREKEQANLDKARHHEKDLKEQIIRTEKDLEGEHSGRLRAERDHQEVKVKYDAIAEEKRVLSTKAMSLETTLEALRKELAELKSANAKLKEKREDIQWVAKSEFDELQQRHQQLVREYKDLKDRAPGGPA